MKSIIFSFLCSLFLIGCISNENNTQVNSTINTNLLSSIEKSPTTSAVIIGMENSKAFGHCPGSAIDSKNAETVISAYTDNVIVLNDKNATIRNVSSALNDAVTNELCIVYYSGHGGSHAFNDSNTQLEADKVDEYLCLYDGAFRDDSIWEIISKSKGRVFLIFDCCHSATMFRVPGITFGGLRYEQVYPRGRESTVMKMLCWSGCPDNTYSYGSSSGGKFSNCIWSYFKPNQTYDQLWKKLSSDKALKSYEVIQTTNINEFDLNSPVFK